MFVHTEAGDPAPSRWRGVQLDALTAWQGKPWAVQGHEGVKRWAAWAFSSCFLLPFPRGWLSVDVVPSLITWSHRLMSLRSQTGIREHGQAGQRPDLLLWL